LNTRSKQLRAATRRSEIMASASSALRRLGLRAGMRQIADAAGLSAANLYYYFRNKHELVYSCQDGTLDHLLVVARQARLQAGSRAQLAWLIHGHLRLVLDEASGGPAHLEFQELAPPLYRKLVHKRDRYERAVRALIAAGQARGELRRGDPKLAAFALLGALNWAARWYRAGGAHDVEEVASSFTQLLLDGLAGPTVKKNGRGRHGR
jgi:AcrR family transcriptional regulator